MAAGLRLVLSSRIMIGQMIVQNRATRAIWPAAFLNRLGAARVFRYSGTEEGFAMPLRDHFRPPLDDRRSWEGLHGGWPMLIAMGLNRHLPPRFVAEPQVHHGSSIEIDVGTYESEDVETPAVGSSENGGGVATAVWAPPVPTLSVATDLLDFDEFEVRIYDTKRGYRLVAALEIVSPANKDRPESRRAFVTKCAALLQKRVSVAIVDLVTSRSCNLYKELMEFIDQKDLFLADVDPPLYAVSCRCIRDGQAGRLETWSRPLALGQPLPTLPLWLADNFAVPVDLEQSYEESCRGLRIP
jgi:hypothetical protein